MKLTVGKTGAIPSKHDPRTVTYAAISKALNIADPRRVPKLHHDTRRGHWDIFGNDHYGCCTFAAIARIMMNNSRRRGRLLNITGKHVINAYLDSTGGADVGQMPINALNYCRNIGFKLDDGSTVKVLAFARVGDRDVYEQQSALTTFGSLYVAADLPLRVGYDYDHRWSLLPREQRDEDDAPRSMGGHAYPVFGFQNGEQFVVPWNEDVVEEAAWTSLYRKENWVLVDDQEDDQLLLGVLFAQLAAIKDTASPV